MCERLAVAGMPGLLTRRRFLGVAAAAGAAVLARPIRAAAGAPTTVDLGGVPVVPRAAWGGDLAPAGPLLAEPDVRFLLVHHSVDPGNTYARDDVARILRGFVAFHTGDKGWPDLAYNFLVDRFGTVWEGRTGSLAGPVAGDATGGSQGFDQLCCFIGNHQTEEPSPEAFTAMGRLLGALATRYRVPLTAGATATFVSRGSNLHPPGTTVTTPTITGHRDMSRTQCPGDRVATRLPELRLLAAGGAAPAAAPSSTTTTPTVPTTTTTTPAVPTTTASTTTTTATTTTAPPATASTTTTSATTSTTAVPRGGGGAGLGPPAAVAGGALVAAGAAAAVAVVRTRRPEPEEPSGPEPVAERNPIGKTRFPPD